MIPMDKLYPLSPHVWDLRGPSRLIVDALPEAQWYRQEGRFVAVWSPGPGAGGVQRWARIYV